MRIAIPIESTTSQESLDAPVSMHFGHVESFTIIDLDFDDLNKDNKKILNLSRNDLNSLEVVSNPMENHTCFAPVKVLIDNEVDVLLISGIGGRPLMFCLQNGIKVYQGAIGKVVDVLRDFLAGFLTQAMEGTCQGAHQH